MKNIICIIFLSGLVLFGYFGFAKAISPGDVVINEVAWMGTETSYNDEWIELYNNSDALINLGGWTLKATDGAPEIKLARTVLANGFYLLERTDDNTVPGIAADQIYTGALGNNGEKLELFDNLGNLIDSVDASSGWPAGDNSTKQTMERNNSLLTSDVNNWQNSQNPGGTPMAENSSLPTTETAETGSPLTQEISEENFPTTTPPVIADESYKVEPRKIDYPSGVIINEILPSPTGADEKEEWIEIFNKNDFEVNLSGWQITDIAGKTEVYIFPEGTIIGPASFLVLARPTTKITLNNQSDGLRLLQPNGNTMDEMSYENAPRGESYSLFDSGWAWTSAPTPGLSNILPASTPKPEEKTAEDGPPRTGLAAIGEQAAADSNASFLILVAVFTSLFSGVIILILKHVRT